MTPNTGRGYPELFNFTSHFAALPQLQALLRLSDWLAIYHETEIEDQKVAILGMLLWRMGSEGLPQRILDLSYRIRSMCLVLKLKRNKGKDTPNSIIGE